MTPLSVPPGHCLVGKCRYAQSPDSTIPLCIGHRDSFQRSVEYREWRAGANAGDIKRQGRALADWVEAAEAQTQV